MTEVSDDDRVRSLLGATPTQGKCLRCRRFYYFVGRLLDRHCPNPACNWMLARTSDELDRREWPRFVVYDGARVRVEAL